MNRTFVLGDIHGAYLALRQCLDRAGFDPAADRLIFLGDICDGWPQTKESIDELLRISNLIHLLGNHDFWFYDWLKYGEADSNWLEHGGKSTVASYKGIVPDEHIRFIGNARTYFEEDNRLFVHAGIPPGKHPENCSQQQLLWDRTLPSMAMTLSQKGESAQITTYQEVFVGHTPIPSLHPVKYCEVWMMDTGAGWSGVLSMMNVDTKECFISDPVPSLYPGIEGRKRV